MADQSPNVNSLPTDAFAPLATEQQSQAITRPSLSYWQDAWIRLKTNRRAIISLYIVIGLLLFTVAGPLVWTQDPAVQDIDQISQAPGADRTVSLLNSYAPWDGSNRHNRINDKADDSATGTDLWIVEPPNTESVRLAWTQMPGATGYMVYRDIYPASTDGALGLPLVEILSATDTYFEDRLNLQQIHYHYHVVAVSADGPETDQRHDLEVMPKRVITREQAIRRGFMDADSPPPEGSTFELPNHPLGTDYLGRDMLARLMEGARVSLFIGIVGPLLFVMFGVIYGSTAGFMGGKVDQLMMRFADFVVALPFLLFMILFKIAFGIGAGESGIMPMLIALVVLSWPATARLVRGQILQIREEGYINAAQLLGAKTNYLVLRHMIPNTMGVILVTLTFAVPSAIFTEAFLSFIGMGVAPPTASWGSMCNEGLKTMLSHPHELIFPALIICITVLAFNMLGDGLRDALDARMRSRE